MQRANEELSTNAESSQAASPAFLTQSLNLVAEEAEITLVTNLLIAIIEQNFEAVDNLLKNPALQELITNHTPRSAYAGNVPEEAQTYLAFLEQLQSKIKEKDNPYANNRHFTLQKLITNREFLSAHLILRAAIDIIGTSNSQDLTILERLLQDQTIVNPRFQDKELEPESWHATIMLWENNALCKAISLQNKAVIRSLLSVSASLFSSDFLFDIDEDYDNDNDNSLGIELEHCYLLFALKAGADLEIIEMLLNSAANQNILQSRQALITVLIYALEMKRTDVFNLVLTKAENVILDNANIFNSSLLFAAIENNHIEFMAKALKHPTIIDNINDFGAIYYFKDSCILYGSNDITFNKDNAFKTLLTMAAQYDRKEIIALILDIPQALTNQDILSTAASIALRCEHKDSYDTLLIHPAVKDAVSNNTRLLCTAIELGKTDIVQSLTKLASIQRIIHHVVVEQELHDLSNPLININRINPSTQIVAVDTSESDVFNQYENPLITAAKYASSEIFDILLNVPAIGDNNETVLEAICYALSNIDGNYLLNKLLALEKTQSYIQSAPVEKIENLLISVLNTKLENTELFNILLARMQADNNLYPGELITIAIENNKTQELSALLKLQATDNYLQNLREHETYSLIFCALKANSNSIFTSLLTKPALTSKLASLPCNLLIDLTGHAALNCTTEIFNKLLNILGEPALIAAEFQALYSRMVKVTLLNNVVKANRLTICLRYLDNNLIDYFCTTSSEYWLNILKVATYTGNFSFQYALICKIFDKIESCTFKLAEPSLSQEARQNLTNKSHGFKKILSEYMPYLKGLTASQVGVLELATGVETYNLIELSNKARALLARRKENPEAAANTILLAQYTAYRALQFYNSPWALEIKTALGANLNAAINLINGTYYNTYHEKFIALPQTIYDLIPKPTVKSTKDKLADAKLFNKIDAKVSYKIMQFSNPYYQHTSIQLKDNIEYINEIANLITLFSKKFYRGEFIEQEKDAVIYFFIKNNNDKELENLVLLQNPSLEEEEEEVPEVKRLKLTNNS